MLTILFLLLASYAVGVVLPLCFPRMPQTQGVVGSICACAASIFGIALGISGLVASEPLTASVTSVIPFLAFAVRLDPLSSFFVLTISLAGLAASIYAMGYLKGYCQLKLNRADFLPRARNLNVEQSMEL
jgi:hydrogenase-4 component B